MSMHRRSIQRLIEAWAREIERGKADIRGWPELRCFAGDPTYMAGGVILIEDNRHRIQTRENVLIYRVKKAARKSS